MNKRIGLVLLAGLVVAAPRGWAQEQTHTQTMRHDMTAPEATPPAAPPAAAPGASLKDAKRAEAMAKLGGTWAIEYTPMSGQKPKRPLKDTLQFAQGKVSAQSLSKDGYPTTNYTLTIGDDGIPVWETMQTSEKNGVVFWRGELHEDSIQGVMSKHPLEGNSEDFSFSGTQTSNEAPEMPSAKPAEKAAPAKSVAPASKPTTPAPAAAAKTAPAAKKKKGSASH